MKNCVCTVVVGNEINEISRHSLPIMKTYAESVDADFIVLEKSVLTDKFRNATYEKFQLEDLLRTYVRVLFLDADILVMPGAENVFKLVPEEALGVTIVGHRLPCMRRERQALQKIFHYPLDPDRYFNAGVILASRRHTDLFDPRRDDIVTLVRTNSRNIVKTYHDQSILNYRVQRDRIRLYDLGPRFNFTRTWENFHLRFAQSFVHYAGLGDQRVALMQKDATIGANTLLCKIIATLTWISKIRDRYLETRGFRLRK